MSIIQIIWFIFSGITLLFLCISFSFCMILKTMIHTEEVKVRIKKMKLETKVLEDNINYYE